MENNTVDLNELFKIVDKRAADCKLGPLTFRQATVVLYDVGFPECQDIKELDSRIYSYMSLHAIGRQNCIDSAKKHEEEVRLIEEKCARSWWFRLKYGIRFGY